MQTRVFIQIKLFTIMSDMLYMIDDKRQEKKIHFPLSMSFVFVHSFIISLKVQQ